MTHLRAGSATSLQDYTCKPASGRECLGCRVSTVTVLGAHVNFCCEFEDRSLLSGSSCRKTCTFFRRSTGNALEDTRIPLLYFPCRKVRQLRRNSHPKAQVVGNGERGVRATRIYQMAKIRASTEPAGCAAAAGKLSEHIYMSVGKLQCQVAPVQNQRMHSLGNLYTDIPTGHVCWAHSCFLAKKLTTDNLLLCCFCCILGS